MAYSRRTTVYKVRRSDTVESVANDFEVPPGLLRRWNHLHSNSLQGHHILYVHLPVIPGREEPRLVVSKSASGKKLHKASAGKLVRHKVQPGETLYSIAKSHNTTVAALKQNNRNLATLRPGMILVIDSR